jgi:hypothetical protein
VTTSASLRQEIKVYIVKRLQDVEAALNSFRIGFENVMAAVAAVASGTLVTPPIQRGWFMKIFMRLWTATASYAPDVKEIADSAATVVDAIEAAQDMMS